MRRSLLSGTVGAAMLVGLACDIPTEAPQVEQTWIIPVRDLGLSAKQFLPASADTTDDGTGFEVTPDTTSTAAILGALCGMPCINANGATIPKPAFTADVTTTIALADSVNEITLGIPGIADVVLTNNLGFDPIRPGAGNTGRLVITLSSGGVTIGTDIVDGASVALPNGGALTRRVTVPTGTVIRNGVTVTSRIESPAGGPVQINTAATFGIEARPNPMQAAIVKILVFAKQVAAEGVQVDVSSVGGDIRDQIVSAGLELELDNPLPIQGDLEARFRVAGADVIPPKTFSITPGPSSITLVFSREEFLLLADHATVDVGAQGSVSSAGEVTLTPETRVDARMRIGVRIRVGGTVE